MWKRFSHGSTTVPSSRGKPGLPVLTVRRVSISAYGTTAVTPMPSATKMTMPYLQPVVFVFEHK